MMPKILKIFFISIFFPNILLANTKFFQEGLDFYNDKKFNKALISNHIKNFKKKYSVNDKISSYFIFTDTISNKLYDEHEKKIEILKKNGDTLDISEISKRIKVSMSTNKKKYFLCYVK